MLASDVDKFAVAVEVCAKTLRVYCTGEILCYLRVGLISRQSSIGFKADGGCDG